MPSFIYMDCFLLKLMEWEQKSEQQCSFSENMPSLFKNLQKV